MKKLLQRGAYVFSALVTFFAVGLVRVGAQSNSTSNGFKISPVRSELTIEKGKSDTITITLENPADGATTAKPVVNDFVASDDESGEPRLILDDNAPLPKNDFKKLVGNLQDVQLGPREKKDITVRVSVPADANAGGYYGAIRYVPVIGDPKNNVGLTASVGTIVLVKVPGNLTERLDLVQLSAAAKSTRGSEAELYKARSFFTHGDVAVMVRLKNSGDIHVQPFGKVLVKNMFGKIVESYEFNENQPRANILPESTRKFANDLGKRRYIGRYTIEANLGYSQGSGDLITAKSSFWYIPTPILFGLIIIVIALVGTGYWFIRKQKARRQHKHEVNKRKI